MDNYFKAIEDRLALARRCLPLFNGNAELKLQLEGEILKFEQPRNQFIHARSAAVPQPPTVASVPSPSTVVPEPPKADPVLPPVPVQPDPDMANTLAPRIPRRRAYWAVGQPVGAPVLNFRQLQYLPLPNAEPDLDKALQGAWLDCGLDIHKKLIEFNGAAKVWMTVQVEYEPVNPTASKQPFDQYLSATPTRIFKSEEPLTPSKNPYIDSLRILTNRIREFNAKYIRDKSGLRLSRVLKFTL